MRHLLITGANGYLGSALVKEIESNPISEAVTLAEHSSKISHVPSGYNVVAYADLVSGKRGLESFDAVCHLGTHRVGDKDPRRAESIRNFGKLLAQMSKSKVKSLMFSSSQAIYGITDPPWMETSPAIPSTDNAWEKLTIEEMVRLSSEISVEMMAASLRFPKLVGPGNGFRMNQGEVLNALCFAAINESKPKLPQGFLDKKFDLMDVRDAARFTAKFLSSPSSEWPSAINVGRGVPISGGDLVALVGSISSSKFGKKLQYEKIQAPGSAVRNFGMNTDLQKKLFGDFQCRPLEETVSDTLSYLSSKPA